MSFFLRCIYIFHSPTHVHALDCGSVLPYFSFAFIGLFGQGSSPLLLWHPMDFVVYYQLLFAGDPSSFVNVVL